VSLERDELGVSGSHLSAQLLLQQLASRLYDALHFDDAVVQRREPAAQLALESRQLVTVLLYGRLQRSRLVTHANHDDIAVTRMYVCYMMCRYQQDPNANK